MNEEETSALERKVFELQDGLEQLGYTVTKKNFGSGREVDTGTNGHLRGGQTTYNTGTGYFLGYHGTAFKFSIGNPSGDYLTWDGTNLVFTGSNTSVGLFGTAADGDVTISTDTTLSADKNYRSLTINTGINLNCAGYAVYVAGTLTNNGTIRNN